MQLVDEPNFADGVHLVAWEDFWDVIWVPVGRVFHDLVVNVVQFVPPVAVLK